MGRHRNNPQLKGKKKSSQSMLTEIESSELSVIEFKTMVIRKSNELTDNYQKQQESYR